MKTIRILAITFGILGTILNIVAADYLAAIWSLSYTTLALSL